jgi:hypothetical protein
VYQLGFSSVCLSGQILMKAGLPVKFYTLDDSVMFTLTKVNPEATSISVLGSGTDSGPSTCSAGYRPPDVIFSPRSLTYSHRKQTHNPRFSPPGRSEKSSSALDLEELPLHRIEHPEAERVLQSSIDLSRVGYESSGRFEHAPSSPAPSPAPAFPSLSVYPRRGGDNRDIE